jgi:hypothetical protein
MIRAPGLMPGGSLLVRQSGDERERDPATPLRARGEIGHFHERGASMRPRSAAASARDRSRHRQRTASHEDQNESTLPRSGTRPRSDARGSAANVAELSHLDRKCRISGVEALVMIDSPSQPATIRCFVGNLADSDHQDGVSEIFERDCDLVIEMSSTDERSRSVASRITIIMIPWSGRHRSAGDGHSCVGPRGDGRYFTTTPQAMRAPAFPAGSVFMSSAAA